MFAGTASAQLSTSLYATDFDYADLASASADGWTPKNAAFDAIDGVTSGGPSGQYLTPDTGDGDRSLSSYKGASGDTQWWKLNLTNSGVAPGGIRIVGINLTYDQEVPWTRFAYPEDGTNRFREARLDVSFFTSMDSAPGSAGTGVKLDNEGVGAGEANTLFWFDDTEMDARSLSQRGVTNSSGAVEILNNASFDIYFGNRGGDSNEKNMHMGLDNLDVSVDYWLNGDAQEDGVVDVLDLSILATNFGTTSGATVATGDFNNDGAVDVLDLSILASNFGLGTPVAASPIPEPASLSLLALGGLALIRRR